MTPEIKVFVLTAAVITFAYVAIYPQLRTKTLNRMMILDLALSATLLLVVGAVYYGSSLSFSLIFFCATLVGFHTIKRSTCRSAVFHMVLQKMGHRP